MYAAMVLASIRTMIPALAARKGAFDWIILLQCDDSTDIGINYLSLAGIVGFFF